MNQYEYWLHAAQGLGDSTRRQLMEAFVTAEEVYLAREQHLRLLLDEKKLALLEKSKKSWNLEEKYQHLLEAGIRMVCEWEEAFPKRLKEIPDPPFALYYKGALPQEHKLSVAVVGARECSEYGRYIGRAVGQQLGAEGIQVISGMARGIDGISQEAALEAGGYSCAILGCGVDVCYPRGNKELYDRLERQGGLVSTYPPGTAPRPQLFPPRNRIVSGFADVVLVIEAGQKSGTLITVEMALEQGREVYAVPGRITDRLSDGCNRLLQDGAQIFFSPRDFVEELKNNYPRKLAACRREHGAGEGDRREEDSFGRENACGEIKHGQEGMSREDGLILSVLDLYPQSVETLAVKLEERGMHREVGELLGRLMQLCLEGSVIQNSGSWFSKSR